MGKKMGYEDGTEVDLRTCPCCGKVLREKKCFSLVIATASHFDWSASVAMKN